MAIDLQSWPSIKELVVSTADANTEDWHSVRRLGIGGSDVAAIAGISPWSSPYAMWLEKTNRYRNEEVSLQMELGHLFEPVVAEVFARRNPELIVGPNPGTLRHPTIPYMLVNLDRLVYDLEGNLAGFLECKSGDPRTLDKWEQGVPDYYMTQVQHGLAVTGLQKCWVAVLLGNSEYMSFEVERDDELIDMLIDIETKFWDQVVHDVPPPIDSSYSTGAALAGRYDVDPDSVVELSSDMEFWVQEYRIGTQMEKDGEARKKAASNVLKDALKEATVGTLYGVPVCSWNVTKATEYTVKKQAGRQFRLTPPKKEKP